MERKSVEECGPEDVIAFLGRAQQLVRDNQFVAAFDAVQIVRMILRDTIVGSELDASDEELELDDMNEFSSRLRGVR